jgi:hypothetical protein
MESGPNRGSYRYRAAASKGIDLDQLGLTLEENRALRRVTSELAALRRRNPLVQAPSAPETSRSIEERSRIWL